MPLRNNQAEVEILLALQSRIANRLTDLGFTDGDAVGNLSHRLAEAALFAKKLDSELMPDFFSTSVEDVEKLGELAVELQYGLLSLREELEELEPALIKLMNHLNK